MVVSLTNSVDFTPQEEKAYDEIKKELTENKLRSLGVEYIRATAKLKTLVEAEDDTSFIQVENGSQAKIKLKRAVLKFKYALEDFRDCRKKVILQEIESSTETALSRMNSLISEDIEGIINFLNGQVTSLFGQICYSKDLQRQINVHSLRLKKLTAALLHETILKRKNLHLEEIRERQSGSANFMQDKRTKYLRKC